MSDDLISKLLTVAGTLLGAVVGALITSLTANRIERRKWVREKQEKLVDLQRKALGAALEWIEPMRLAEYQASALVMTAIQGQVNHSDFLARFPPILSILATKDLPADQRAVLPEGIHARGIRIVHYFDELSGLGVKYGQTASYKGMYMAGYQECSKKLDTIRQEITELEKDLKEAFSKTFG